MSHVASVKCYVQDLDALASVADRLGFELVRDAKTYAWFGQWVGDFRGSTAAVDNGHRPEDFGKCLHKLRRKDARAGDYEIGVVARPDGQPGYELVYDNWSVGGSRVEELAGRGLSKLKDEIACEVSTRIMRRKGYRVSRTVNQQGAIVLNCSK